MEAIFDPVAKQAAQILVHTAFDEMGRLHRQALELAQLIRAARQDRTPDLPRLVDVWFSPPSDHEIGKAEAYAYLYNFRKLYFDKEAYLWWSVWNDVLHEKCGQSDCWGSEPPESQFYDAARAWRIQSLPAYEEESQNPDFLVIRGGDWWRAWYAIMLERLLS